MLCDECKSKPAVVHIAQLYNGQKVEMHLCPECAAHRGIEFFSPAEAFSLPKLLGTLFGVVPEQDKDKRIRPVKDCCPNCGTSFGQIGQQGRLGCSECYQVYQNELEPILRRIHGNSQHTGKIPQRGAGKLKSKRHLEQLKGQLQEAVAAEQYERAAEIRDRIKILEKEI